MAGEVRPAGEVWSSRSQPGGRMSISPEMEMEMDMDMDMDMEGDGHT